MRDNKVIKRVLAKDQRALVADYTREAVAFIAEHQESPFFLYLPHSAVHFPLYPSEEFHGRSGNGLMGDWIEEVDWSVGQVLGALRKYGLAENTLVIFTSDNGGAPRHGASNAPLRGGKGSVWEGGMRVPTVAWWPGKVPADTETFQITSMMDILPTFAQLAGADIPTDRKIDGGDLWPLLSGKEGAMSPHQSFLYFRGLQLQAVRDGDWKLHLKSGELYNLRDDISESKNVAAQHAKVVSKLQDIAAANEADLGNQKLGPGCRPLGQHPNPTPLIDHNDTIRVDAR